MRTTCSACRGVLDAFSAPSRLEPAHLLCSRCARQEARVLFRTRAPRPTWGLLTPCSWRARAGHS